MKPDAKKQESKVLKEAQQQDLPPQPQPRDGSQASSGEGASSAYARMKSQLEQRKRRQPAEDPAKPPRD